MTDIKRIVDIFGGEATLGRDIRSAEQLAELIKTGLPRPALEIVAKRLYPRPNDTKAFIHCIAP